MTFSPQRLLPVGTEVKYMHQVALTHSTLRWQDKVASRLSNLAHTERVSVVYSI